MKLSYISLLILLINVGTVAGHYLWPTSEVIEVERIVEVERIIEIPTPYEIHIPEVIIEREIQIIEIPTIIYQTNYTVIEVPVITQKTEIVEVPVYLEVNNVRDFENMGELYNFIKSDTTDGLGYSSRFNCMDFALTVVDNALKGGYRVVFLYSYNLETGQAHALNMAYVKSSAEWIIWDPQTDKILWDWDSRITDGVN